MPDPDSRLCVSVVDALGRPVRARSLAAWLARTAPRSARGEVTVALVSDARIRALNRQYRNRDEATDVLSFGSGVQGPGSTVHWGPGSGPVSKVRSPRSGVRTPPATRDPGPDLGDIVIARGVAARQARAMGHSLETELRILALHGLLHLIGYDHERDQGQMRRLEARLRRRGGLRAGLIERTR